MIGYTDSTALQAYAAARGITIDGDAGQLLTKALDYLETLNYAGTRTDPTQALSWPRDGVYVDGVELDKYTVPAGIVKAQHALALEIDAGNDPMATVGRAVKREKVDVLEVEYADNAGAAPFMAGISALLADFLANGGGASGFDVYR